MAPDPLDILRGPDPDVAADPVFVARLRERLAAGVDHDDDVLPTDLHDLDRKVFTVDFTPVKGQSRRSLRLLAAAAAVAIVALVAALAVSARNDRDTIDVVDTSTSTTSTTTPSTTTPSTTTPSTTTPSSTTPSTTTRSGDAALGLPAILSAADSGVTSFATAAKPAQVVAGGSSVWVIPNLGPIQRFDAASGRLLGTVPLQLESFPTRPAVAFGSLWMATEWNDRVNRIDLATGEIVARIAIPGGLRGVGGSIPDGPAAADNGVWVLSDDSGLDRTLLRIDPATNAVVQTLPAPKGTETLGFGFGSLWVSHVPLTGSPGGVYRVDPTTGEVMADIKIAFPALLRSAFGSIWTSGVEQAPSGGEFETLNRIDPVTNTVVAEIPYTIGAEGWRTDFVEAGGSLWVSSKSALAVRIDPSQNRVVARYLPSTGGGGLATDGTSLWFTGWDDAQLHRLPLG